MLLKRNIYSTSVHFSNLTYQSLNRCINKNPKYEKDRFISQIKWYNLCDDIIEQMNNNVIIYYLTRLTMETKKELSNF